MYSNRWCTIAEVQWKVFAFVMERAWGDLRKLVDVTMLYFGNHATPRSIVVGTRILLHIACGMKALPRREIIHRDLKAANVLIFLADAEKTCPGDCQRDFDSIFLGKNRFSSAAAAYECSVGVMGTRVWRAPEILVAIKDRNIDLKPELFTKQAYVFSFGMTCYEVLLGHIPFEELLCHNNYDDVIGGARPKLPSKTTPLMRSLVNRCWHKNPSMKPTFETIVGSLVMLT